MITKFDDIHVLIERYFAGETSLDEERRLRFMLVSPDAPATDDVAEARAVMGYASVMSRPATARASVAVRLRSFVPKIVAAASVAVVLTFVWGSIGGGMRDVSNGECMAYVGGVRVSDADDVMAMMGADLRSIGEASADVDNGITEELNAISDILK